MPRTGGRLPAQSQDRPPLRLQVAYGSFVGLPIFAENTAGFCGSAEQEPGGGCFGWCFESHRSLAERL